MGGGVEKWEERNPYLVISKLENPGISTSRLEFIRGGFQRNHLAMMRFL